MDTTQQQLAAMIYGTGAGIHADRVLSDVADELQNRGCQLAGTVQRAAERDDRCACDMIVRDLSTGREVQISEDRGPNARGCRLDPRILEALVGSTASAIEGGVDAVIINKFGKREAHGAGFRDVIGQALLLKVPLIIGVNIAYLESWRSFAGDLASELEPDKGVLLSWLTRRVSMGSIRRDGYSEQPSPESGW